MKEQFLKMVSILTEKEIEEICDAINETSFEFGWNDPSENFQKLIDWCWEDK